MCSDVLRSLWHNCIPILLEFDGAIYSVEALHQFGRNWKVSHLCIITVQVQFIDALHKN